MANYVREVHRRRYTDGIGHVDRSVVAEHSPDQPVSRAQSVISYIVATLSVLLAIRFILSLFGANRENVFADVIYTITGPFVAPFQGLFGGRTDFGVSRFETETIVAIIVYMLVGWAISALLNTGRREIDMDIEG